MHIQNAPLLVALAASILLLFHVRPRVFPAIALVASGIEVLRGFGLLSFKVPVIGAAVLFGAAMAVGGAGSWVRSGGKVVTSAATILTLIGVMRVLARYL
jgi:hypothetical protein